MRGKCWWSTVWVEGLRLPSMTPQRCFSSASLTLKAPTRNTKAKANNDDVQGEKKVLKKKTMIVLKKGKTTSTSTESSLAFPGSHSPFTDSSVTGHAAQELHPHTLQCQLRRRLILGLLVQPVESPPLTPSALINNVRLSVERNDGDDNSLAYHRSKGCESLADVIEWVSFCIRFFNASSCDRAVVGEVLRKRNTHQKLENQDKEVDLEMKSYYDVGKAYMRLHDNSVVALSENGDSGGYERDDVLGWMCHAILLSDPHFRISSFSHYVCYPTLPSLLVASHEFNLSVNGYYYSASKRSRACYYVDALTTSVCTPPSTSGDRLAHWLGYYEGKRCDTPDSLGCSVELPEFCNHQQRQRQMKASSASRRAAPSPLARCLGLLEAQHGNALLRYWNSEATLSPASSGGDANSITSSSGGDGASDMRASGGGGDVIASNTGSSILHGLQDQLVGPTAAGTQGLVGGVLQIHRQVIIPLARALFHRDNAQHSSGAGGPLIGVPLLLARWSVLLRWHASRTAYGNVAFHNSLLYFLCCWGANPVLRTRQQYERRLWVTERRYAQDARHRQQRVDGDRVGGVTLRQKQQQQQQHKKLLSVAEMLAAAGAVAPGTAAAMARAQEEQEKRRRREESVDDRPTAAKPLFVSKMSRSEAEVVNNSPMDRERGEEDEDEEEEGVSGGSEARIKEIKPYDIHLLGLLRAPVEPEVCRLLLFRFFDDVDGDHVDGKPRKCGRKTPFDGLIADTPTARINAQLRHIEWLPTDVLSPTELVHHVYQTSRHYERCDGDASDGKQMLYALQAEEARIVGIPLSVYAIERHLQALITASGERDVSSSSNNSNSNSSVSGSGGTTARMSLGEIATRLLWPHEYGTARATEMLWVLLNVYSTDGRQESSRIHLEPPPTTSSTPCTEHIDLARWMVTVDC